MCCTQSLKIYDATNRHLGTIAELCEAISSQLRYVWTIGKRNCLTTIPPPYNTMKFGPVVAQIDLRVWNMPANCNKFRVLAALLHGTLLVGVSWTLRCWTQGATYTRQSGHDVGPWPTFIVINNLQYIFLRNILLSLCNWLLNAFGSAEVVFKKYMDILHFYGRLRSRCGHYIFVLCFLCASFFFACLISAVTLTDWMSAIPPHMVWLYCECTMEVWNVLHVAWWKYRMQKGGKKSPLGQHGTTSWGYIFAS